MASNGYGSKVWEFPKHRFFEWEPGDEETCRRLGIGREVVRHRETLIPNAVCIDVKPRQHEVEIMFEAR